MLKSKIVLSPAGSGKTERLARRYIELLENGVLPERILTITFTEKAAAEMKARIFQILKQENPELYKKIIEKSMLLRIKTIDSFCLSLLKRFAQLCGYEYDLDVLSDSSYLQKLSIVEAMSKIEKSGPELKDYQRLVYIIANQKFKGWGIIEELFGALYERRLTQERVQIAVTEGLNELFVIVEELKNHPITIQKIPEFENLILNPLEAQNIEKIIQNFEIIKHKFLQSSGKLRSAKKSPLENEWYKKIFDCYRIVNQLNNQKWLKEAVDLFTNCFLEEFSKLKKERNLVDFADLEILTYKILTENPNWANVLYFFDEHTDHILVDEFQDTSFLQWAIIRKLTEEWFAGLGIKQEQQIKPTIFLVGDDKQSIYMFRNAHPEIFNYARAYFESRLKGDFDYEEVTSNYRSLPAITHFTNQVFSQLMGADKQSDLSTIKYKAFESKRNNSNPGVVEIILISSKDQKDIRKKEAEILAKKILTIINTPIIYDKDEKPQSVRFEDIAVLLRSRTYLDKYEKAFRKYRIPFVIIKGMGFYSTPEVALLKELVSFLVDPNNDYSFYVILKSPLFGLTEKELLTISQYQSNGIVNSLWQRFQKYAQTQPSYQELVNKIIKWTSTVGLSSLVEIIQEILNSQNIWRIFWEEERIVNIRKFLNMVDELETKGLTPDFIVDYFEKNAQN
ncbi:MAG: UvrD-helicase domain-containing protein, partial [candidate division WOR-3 bacterium]|nr:UvrD-helicase domain-containing protein [candidate division WOR-3 bacterium]MDW7987969.1 UvrD-helicase domain-containing protein [candidate division WOR-3 bacterium]